jgi:uncharacterized protein
LKDFSVNILGLSQKIHHFSFHLDDAFFGAYQNPLCTSGNCEAHLALDKHETFIDAQFQIRGTVDLVCDRSLEPFAFPIALNEKIIFKYGEEEGELSDEIVIITRDRVGINIGQYLHEFITLAIPMKRLHPRFDEEVDDFTTEGQVVYTSFGAEEDPEKAMDPRWEQLKKVTIKK